MNNNWVVAMKGDDGDNPNRISLITGPTSFFLFSSLRSLVYVGTMHVDDDEDAHKHWLLFAYSLVSSIDELPPCFIIQLVAKYKLLVD